MIGDWVECVDSSHEKKEYAQIDAIEEGKTCILVRRDNCNWFLDISFINPIPLTPEILEKNGIKWFCTEPSGRTTYCCNEPWINCTYIPNNGWVICVGPAGSIKVPYSEASMIQYVHQLQHLLRLAGYEKEIIV
jgi:hypothetical protein